MYSNGEQYDKICIFERLQTKSCICLICYENYSENNRIIYKMKNFHLSEIYEIVENVTQKKLKKRLKNGLKHYFSAEWNAML